MSGRKAVVRMPLAQPASPEHLVAPTPVATIHSIDATRNHATAAVSEREPGTRQDSDLDPISGVMMAVGMSLVLWVVIIAAIAIF